jgi:hypothetical protein
LLHTTMVRGCTACNKTKVTYYRAFGLRDEFCKTKHAGMHSGQLCTLCTEVTGQLGTVISYIQWALGIQTQWGVCTVGTGQPGTVISYVQWALVS